MGAKPYHVMSPVQVALEMGITVSGVEKLETSALRKLKRKWIMKKAYEDSIHKEQRRSQNPGTLIRDEY